MDGIAIATIIVGLGATFASAALPTLFPQANRFIWWLGMVLLIGGILYLMYDAAMKSTGLHPWHLLVTGSAFTAIGLILVVWGVVWQWPANRPLPPAAST